MRSIVTSIIVLGLAGPLQALALDFDLEKLRYNTRADFGGGVSIRTQERSSALVGKLNLNPGLCPDNCYSFGGNTEPNQRLLAAPGAFSVSGDDGNLNYDRYDLTAAPLKLNLQFDASYGNTIFRLTALGLYDVVNANFEDKHPDARFQPAETKRRSEVNKLVGYRAQIREAYLSTQFDMPFLDRPATISIGQQKVSWGESAFLVVNSIAETNPPDIPLLTTPGLQLKEVFIPVPMALFNLQLTDSVNLETYYQSQWKPTILPPQGSFFAASDLINGEYLTLGFGSSPEDPNDVYRLPGIPALVINSGRTVKLLDDKHPRDSGEFGVKLSYFADWFNNGTEFGFYYQHYHARFPILSVFAANKSCARDLPVPGIVGASFVEAFVACGGFSGNINPTAPGQPLEGLEDVITFLSQQPNLQPLFDLLKPVIGDDGLFSSELLPLDTLVAQLEYPEDIDLFGLSFNTTVGNWSLAGEFAFRPNQPLQINGRDVIFAGLGPALPREDVSIGLLTLPAEDVAVPDFLSRYRGQEIKAGDYVRGYERFNTGQLGLTGLRLLGPQNPFGADSILMLVEAGAYFVFDLPSTKVLQLESNDPSATHPSPGSDGTGLPGGTPDPRRFNPTQTTRNFPTDFSWGYRLLLQPTYSGLPGRIVAKPRITVAHDVQGISPIPNVNFIRGRMQIGAGVDFELTQRLKTSINYVWFTGGGAVNYLRDRDFLALGFNYDIF